MSKVGNVFKNPTTGESGYVRIGTDETNGVLSVSDLRIRPGGAVVGEHIHPSINERFTVLSGKVGYRLNGKEGVATSGEVLDIPHGVVHDWWNAGDEVARVIVEVYPAARFEQLIITMFGLAYEGKVDAKGRPNLLQMAVIADEFADAVQFVNPPIWIQRILFGVLAPLGRALGYRAIYPHHYNIPIETVAVEPLPDWVELIDWKQLPAADLPIKPTVGPTLTLNTR